MKVSAYVPCYNARASIGDALQSIRDQKVPAAEVFIIDDGSTDGSGDVSGVKVIRLEPNQGRGAVRTRAMVEAQHELVLSCDAAVRLGPLFLEKALPWFSNEQVAAVFGWIKEAANPSAANRWRGRHLFRSQLAHEESHFASLATGCSVVRKSAVQRVGGFNSALRSGEDADLGQRLLNAGYDVVFDASLFAYSHLENSVWEVLERYARWNTPAEMGVRDYLRQINYALKVMVAADLRAKDFPGACISLLSPHYQFWKRRAER